MEFQRLCDKTQQKAQLIQQTFEQTIAKMATLSAYDCARHASCLGATVVLDCVAMHGLTLASSSAGRKFISKTATLFESAKAEEAIAEIAGIGKIAVEEGVGATSKAIEVIAHNPELAPAGRGVANVIGELAKEGETVWSSIKNAGPMYEKTRIPKCFELTVGNKNFWVAPNATDHMADFIAKARRVSHCTPINSQSILNSFKAAIEEALELGIFYTKEPFVIDCWELQFSPPRSENLLPVIKHALYMPKGFKS